MVTHRPHALDELRLMVAILGITAELEQVGNRAVDIARCSQRITIYSADTALFRALHDFGTATEATLQSSMDAFRSDIGDLTR